MGIWQKNTNEALYYIQNTQIIIYQKTANQKRPYVKFIKEYVGKWNKKLIIQICT